MYFEETGCSSPVGRGFSWYQIQWLPGIITFYVLVSSIPHPSSSLFHFMLRMDLKVLGKFTTTELHLPPSLLTFYLLLSHSLTEMCHR